MRTHIMCNEPHSKCEECLGHIPDPENRAELCPLGVVEEQLFGLYQKDVDLTVIVLPDIYEPNEPHKMVMSIQTGEVRSKNEGRKALQRFINNKDLDFERLEFLYGLNIKEEIEDASDTLVIMTEGITDIWELRLHFTLFIKNVNKIGRDNNLDQHQIDDILNVVCNLDGVPLDWWEFLFIDPRELMEKMTREE